jgi:hypothetical protein
MQQRLLRGRWLSSKRTLLTYSFFSMQLRLPGCFSSLDPANAQVSSDAATMRRLRINANRTSAVP